MEKRIISTNGAPAAIGPYSQAVGAGQSVYLSGQIALDPATGQLVAGGIEAQARRALQNLAAVATAAGGSLADCVKLTIYVTDMTTFPQVNAAMEEFFVAPFPARATVGVASLPRGAAFEIDAVMVLG